MVTIGRFYDLSTAYVVRSRLQSEDIPAFIPEEYSILTREFSMFGLGKSGVRVQVPREHEDEALAILAQEPDEDFNDSVYIPAAEPDVENTGSSLGEHKTFLKLAAAIALGLAAYAILKAVLS